MKQHTISFLLKNENFLRQKQYINSLPDEEYFKLFESLSNQYSNNSQPHIIQKTFCQLLEIRILHTIPADKSFLLYLLEDNSQLCYPTSPIFNTLIQHKDFRFSTEDEKAYYMTQIQYSRVGINWL